jgi:hypothetical protein
MFTRLTTFLDTISDAIHLGARDSINIAPPYPLEKSTNVIGRNVGLVVTILAVVYIIGVQLPLLSPLRRIISDEMIIADSAYSLATGQSPVPALPIWSHIIPAFKTINFHYSPVYLYLLAAVYRWFGMSPEVTGAFHLLIRLLAASLFLLLARNVGLSVMASTVLTGVWVTFVHGAVGRPDDLAFVFLIASVWLLVDPRQRAFVPALAGLCTGLAFLCHPSALLIGFLLNTTLLVRHWQALHKIKPGLVWSVTTMSTCLLWLLWIIPYWAEFRTIFIDFVLPDATSSSYWFSLRNFGHLFLVGQWETGQLFPFHYSLVPVTALLLWLRLCSIREKTIVLENLLLLYPILLMALAVVDSLGGHSLVNVKYMTLLLPVLGLCYLLRLIKKENSAFFNKLLRQTLLLLPLLIIPFILARSRVYESPFRWFNLALVTLLPFVAVTAYASRKNLMSGLERTTLAILVGAIVLQACFHFVRGGLTILGDMEVRKVCGQVPHADLFASIPAGEKLITNNGYTFYQRRSQNPIFWPAGLQGSTAPGVTFAVSYDASFRWAIFPKPVRHNYNPGIKFKWNNSSHQWFSQKFLLRMSHSLEQCFEDSTWAKFSQVPQTLYVYEQITEDNFENGRLAERQ